MAQAPGESLEKLGDMIVRAAESTAVHVRAAKEAIGTVIYGQDKVVEQALITVLCGGHALLVGVPGLAKTKLVDTMGTVLGLDARRIQFTPDLMPSDILGTEVLEETPGGKLKPKDPSNRLASSVTSKAARSPMSESPSGLGGAGSGIDETGNQYFVKA